MGEMITNKQWALLEEVMNRRGFPTSIPCIGIVDNEKRHLFGKDAVMFYCKFVPLEDTPLHINDHYWSGIISEWRLAIGI